MIQPEDEVFAHSRDCFDNAHDRCLVKLIQALTSLDELARRFKLDLAVVHAEFRLHVRVVLLLDLLRLAVNVVSDLHSIIHLSLVEDFG